MKTEKKSNNSAFKNVMLFVLAAACIGTGYYGYIQYQEVQSLEAQMVQERDDMKMTMDESYRKIEENLAKISESEGIIRDDMFNSSSEDFLTAEERIEHEITVIDALLAENRRIIEDLNGQVSEKDERLASYNKQVRKLESRVAEYKTSLEKLAEDNEELQNNLADARMKNDTLAEAMAFQANTISFQENLIELNKATIERVEELAYTGYYTVGTYKDLKEAGVVEKEGGVVGIGTTKTLKEDFEKQQFTAVDIRESQYVPVHSRKAELVTAHNPESYEWILDQDTEEITWLKINDPASFWENNKYVVVVTRDNWELASLAE